MKRRWMGPAALALAAAVVAPVQAQDGLETREVAADLDRDGGAEVYRLHYDGPEADLPSSRADLTVESEGTMRRVEGVAWSGGFHGSLPELEVGPEPSVLVHSMNDAYGRQRWYQTLTIAFRNGDWRVIGLGYAWRDSLDLGAWGSCDLDLLSGRGVVSTPEGEREIDAPFPAPLLWDWPEVRLSLGEVCGF